MCEVWRRKWNLSWWNIQHYLPEEYVFFVFGDDWKADLPGHSFTILNAKPPNSYFLGSVCTSYISETENNNKMEKAVEVILLATVKKAVIGYNWKQNREMRKELNLTCLV